MAFTKKISSLYRNALIFGIIVLILIFFVSFFFFVRNILSIHHNGPIHPHNPIGIFFGGSGSKYPNSGSVSVDEIKGWMTFSYINFRYHLPPKFLEEKLAIHDAKYPDIPIKNYIKKNNLNGTGFIQELKDTIRTLLKDNTK